MRSRLLVPVCLLAFAGVVTSCDDEISGIDENFEENATWEATLASEVAGVPATATGQSWFIDRGNTID